MAVLVWKIQVTLLQFLKAHIFFLCTHSFCNTSLSLLSSVSAAPVLDQLHCLLMPASIMNTSSYARLEWHC